MDSVTNPWWLGGNICAGVPTGAEIATRLGARVWISAHDAEKDVRGLATGMLKTKRWQREEVERALGPVPEKSSSEKQQLGHARKGSNGSTHGGGAVGTEVMRLGSGDEVAVSGAGVLWCLSENEEDRWAAVSAKESPSAKIKDRRRLTRVDHHDGEKPAAGLRAMKSVRGSLASRFRSTATLA